MDRRFERIEQDIAQLRQDNRSRFERDYLILASDLDSIVMKGNE